MSDYINVTRKSRKRKKEEEKGKKYN